MKGDKAGYLPFLNVFESKTARELSGEKIEIGDAFAERLKNFVNLKEEIEEEAKQYFEVKK